MANQIRIKRRNSSGAAGAPSSLKNAELAFNEANNVLYYGYGDDGSGNATSIIGIGGDGSVVSLSGTQTVSGDKTFSGDVDFTGALEIAGVAVSSDAGELNILDGATLTTVELNYLDGVTSAVQTQINTLQADVDQNESDADAAIAANEVHIDNLVTLSGVAKDAENLGAFTGSIITDDSTVKVALQELETEMEDGAGSLTADDAGVADFASGTVTVSGGTGLSSTATGNTLTVDLNNTAVTAAAYGAASKSLAVTVDAQGRLTAAAEATIDIVHTQVSDFDAGVQTNRLDQLAAPTAAVAINGQLLSGLANPVSAQDAATKYYVDAIATGLDVKASCRAATVANITLSNTQTVDGVVLVAGNRVLAKNQTAAEDNGIYVVVDGGAWTRSTDADNTPAGEVTSGMYTFITEGTVNADAGFILSTADPIVLGTTDLTFVQFSGAGQVIAGAGLTKDGNTLDVETASSARIVVNADNIDLATHGTAGTYNGLTVDAYGRASSFSQPTTLAGYSIADGQPLDATLTALAGVTTAANKVIYATGSDAFTTADLTAFGRSVIALGNASAGRSLFGLGDMATQNKASIDITGGTIEGCAIDGGTF
jgi:hypothetical protein